MIIFKDLLSGDELFTDVFKYKEVDGIFYEVECRHITQKADTIDEAAIGGNASAEGGEEDAALDAPGTTSGIDVVLHNRLVETGFKNKKEYQTYLKGYMAKLIGHLTKENPGRVDEFKKQATPAVKKVLAESFKDLQFFMGESCDADAMNVILIYKEDTPFMYLFKDGLIEEKV